MEIKSRVPGKIVRFEKQVGDTVAVRDVLIVMEAMKMKQLVPSPVAGVVKEYKVQPGVGFAMLFLILLSNKGIDAGWLDKKSQEGIAFWSAMYIPIVVAMSSIQNVVAAISGGAVAILGGLLCTVFGFLLIPIMSKNHAAKAE